MVRNKIKMLKITYLILPYMLKSLDAVFAIIFLFYKAHFYVPEHLLFWLLAIWNTDLPTSPPKCFQSITPYPGKHILGILNTLKFCKTDTCRIKPHHNKSEECKCFNRVGETATGLSKSLGGGLQSQQNQANDITWQISSLKWCLFDTLFI